MKTICKKTGMVLLSSSGYSRWAVAEEHPIFTIKLEELITLAATEWSPAQPELDKRLLLLAISANCGLLKWSGREEEAAPAMPSLSIVESSIYNLLKIAGWIDAERYANRDLHYPIYNITTATCQMQTFPDMLHRVIETRHISQAAERNEHRLKVLENAASNLSARCRIGDSKKEGALLRVTAEWAMQVCATELRRERVGDSIREDWIRMLQTSPAKLRAANFSITDVQELREFMLDYLPHGSIISHDVIAHLNRLIDCNVINDVEHGDILAARVLIAANIDAPEQDPEPLRAAFPDVLSYARAKANWQLRKVNKEQLADLALKRASIQARRERLAEQHMEDISAEGDEI